MFSAPCWAPSPGAWLPVPGVGVAELLCGSVLPAPRSGVAESATPFSVVTGALGLGLGVAFGCAFEVATTLAQVLPDCLALAKLPVALGVAVVPAPLTMARRPRMRSVNAKQNSEKKKSWTCTSYATKNYVVLPSYDLLAILV